MDTNLDVRASDAEREAVLTELRQHTDDGRLTLEEFLERLDETYAAKTRRDLRQALRELPVTPAPSARSTGRGGHMATPLIPYLVFAVSMIVLWAIGDRGYFWPIWPLMGWGIPLLGKLASRRRRPEQSDLKIC